jgi:hypothetical protein
MQTTIEAPELLKRQMELERVLKHFPGILAAEERELLRLRKWLSQVPETTRAVIHIARALRRSLPELHAENVETWLEIDGSYAAPISNC